MLIPQSAPRPSLADMDQPLEVRRLIRQKTHVKQRLEERALGDVPLTTNRKKHTLHLEQEFTLHYFLPQQEEEEIRLAP